MQNIAQIFSLPINRFVAWEMNFSQDCFSCLSISFLESIKYSLTFGVPSKRNSNKALLDPNVKILFLWCINSIAAFWTVLKSNDISFTVKSTWKGAICSLMISRCLIWNKWPSIGVFLVEIRSAAASTVLMQMIRASWARPWNVDRSIQEYKRDRQTRVLFTVGYHMPWRSAGELPGTNKKKIVTIFFAF